MWHPIQLAVMIAFPTATLLTVGSFSALALETIGRVDWSDSIGLGLAWTLAINSIIALYTAGPALYSNH